MAANMAFRNVGDAPRAPIDPILFGCALALVVIGFIMVASASIEVSNRVYGASYFLLLRHSIYLLISVCVGFAVLMTPIVVWQRLDWLLMLIAIQLLVLVLIPGIGKEVNGSARWIDLGFFTIQGSEFAKLFTVVYISGYLVRREQEIREHWAGFIKPLSLLALLMLLLLQEPDFGAAVVMMISAMCIIFLAKVPMRRFIPVIIFALVATALIVTLQPYRLDRLTAFANPWDHQFSAGYQLTQALIAFGRGEWFGVGLGNSIQKLFFLPEAHTDFIFSIIAEELGVVGAIILIAIFTAMTLRGFWIGRCAQKEGEDFRAYFAYGVSMLLAIQMIINIGVNIGLLPTKGLTLPLISYGGNSLVVSCILIAILLRIEYEVRQQKTGYKAEHVGR